MAKLETVYIHHPEIGEAEVAPNQVAAYVAAGWLEGPDPDKQAERDHVTDALAAQRRADAEAFAAQAEQAAYCLLYTSDAADE